MFFEGDLQSGISKALEEHKLVACFVTGNYSLLAYFHYSSRSLPSCTFEFDADRYI